MTKIAFPPTVLRRINGPENCELCGSPGLKTELVRDPLCTVRWGAAPSRSF